MPRFDSRDFTNSCWLARPCRDSGKADPPARHPAAAENRRRIRSARRALLQDLPPETDDETRRLRPALAHLSCEFLFGPELNYVYHLRDGFPESPVFLMKPETKRFGRATAQSVRADVVRHDGTDATIWLWQRGSVG